MNGRLLDHVFVNEARDIKVNEPQSPLLKIDYHHKLLLLRLDLNDARMQFAEDLSQQRDFDFQRCDFVELNYAISAIDWELKFDGRGTDETIRIFYDILYGISDEHVPPRPRTRCSYKHPWWTSELQHLRNVVRKFEDVIFEPGYE